MAEGKPCKRHKGPPKKDLKCPICGDYLLVAHHKGSSNFPAVSLHCPTCEIMFCSEDWSDKYAILKLWQSVRDKKAISAWNKRS